MKIISWNTTNACNMYCAHCYRDAGCRAEEELNTEEGKKLLSEIDLEALSEQLRSELKNANGQKKLRIIKRLEVAEAFRASGNKPEWMIMNVLDGFAGTVRRAPKWMIRLQLEWLYRLLREPSRIGRMMRLPKFVFAAWRARGKKE